MRQGQALVVRMIPYQTMKAVEYSTPILCFKKSVIVLKRLPNIPFCFNLKVGPLY